jgi:hypothetical protein
MINIVGKTLRVEYHHNFSKDSNFWKVKPQFLTPNTPLAFNIGIKWKVQRIK